ncbi:MAG: hypothetical protein HRU15_09540, partial [Planctomycetes bacterium]|nr:hypothetical protein [Planctomycetota bacterium]
LLIVISIIGLLASMVLAASAAVMTSAQVSETEALLAKVSAGIHQFEDRYNSIPISTWGVDVDDLEPPNEVSNRLFWRLGTPMTRADRVAYEALIPAAVAAVETTVTPAEADTYKGGFNDATHRWVGQYQDYVMRLLKLVKGEAETIKVKRSWQTISALTQGEVGREFLRKENVDDDDYTTIVDSWGSPLVYVSQYAPSHQFRSINVLPGVIYIYGTDQVGLLKGARETIIDVGNDGSIDDDAALSDIRTHAFSGFESTYELWSAGPDAEFHAIRGELVNEDNVSITEYRKD